ncbi:EAL domain-containing protein [Herbaspirillum rhizosphaerae]|uniref:EAL domain-containing protein n=1 Tax=Herbaspirillum rhizosphaerae TaxID=346179 RepID=A0ABW8ZDJ0_9BURK
MLKPTISRIGILPLFSALFTVRMSRKFLGKFLFTILLAGICIDSCFSKELTIGVYANPPKIFLDKDGVAAGIHIDLIRQIAEQEHWTLRFIPCEWQACLRAVEHGEIDLLPDVAYTDERASILDFHKVPALYSWSILYRNKNVAINSVFDLKEKRIALLSGSVQADYFKQLLENSGISVRFVPVSRLELGFQAVEAGKADAVIGSQQAGDMLAERHGLSDTPIVFQPVKLFFVSAKGRNKDVLDAIDRNLRAWQEDSQSIYFEILRKWGRGSRSQIERTVVWGLIAAIGLFLSALGIAAYLRREVEIRTRELRNSEKSLRVAATVFQSQEAMWVMGPDHRILDINHAFVKVTGFNLAELIDKMTPPFCLVQGEPDYRDEMWKIVKETGQWEGEVHAKKKSDERYIARLTMTAVRDVAGKITHYVGTQTDITQQKLLLEETVRLAYYDSLTGLPNRRLLIERIQSSIATNADNNKDFALIVIDIDNFKDLNDSLGHDVGDQLLKKIANRLVATADSAENVARLGADEFVVLLQGIERSDSDRVVQRFAQRILTAMNDPFELAGLSHHASCCIGASLMQNEDSTAQDMLRRGDLAMYQAKKNGRNTFCLFTVEIENAVNFRTALEFDVRKAIDHKEFFLHYQPQVDLQGQLIGVEALLRWQSPERGLVPPGLFIPVAETCGLMFKIGQWVLRQACEQSAKWERERPEKPIVIAVNVSAIQFCNLEFTSDVSHIITQTGANPALLKMELTETMMVDDVQATVEKMYILKRLGISLSLDDFGTGYSSLSLLKRLPIDQLKIDQSFIKDILVDASDVAIAKSIIALGSALGVDVIAEGVETLEVRDFLSTIGCTKYQGYAFGRPGPADQLAY